MPEVDRGKVDVRVGVVERKVLPLGLRPARRAAARLGVGGRARRARRVESFFANGQQVVGRVKFHKRGHVGDPRRERAAALVAARLVDQVEREDRRVLGVPAPVDGVDAGEERGDVRLEERARGGRGEKVLVVAVPRPGGELVGAAGRLPVVREREEEADSS